MRGETTSATSWICDACGDWVVLIDEYQNTPPKDWRLIGLYPIYVNMALEPNSPHEIKRAVMCSACLAAPVIVKDMF